MNITPDNTIEHSRLENDADQFLIANGFVTASATYHEVMPEQVKSILQSTYTPTALYLRGRSDRIAAHPSGLVLEWECKTHVSRKYGDMCIEALPLAHHILKAQLGVKCLYIYRNPFTGHDCGFWTDQIPPIREIKIPDRWTKEQMHWFGESLGVIFPRTKISPSPHRFGSGDPFAIIDKSTVAELPNWQGLIRVFIGSGGRRHV